MKQRPLQCLEAATHTGNTAPSLFLWLANFLLKRQRLSDVWLTFALQHNNCPLNTQVFTLGLTMISQVEAFVLFLNGSDGLCPSLIPGKCVFNQPLCWLGKIITSVCVSNVLSTLP